MIMINKTKNNNLSYFDISSGILSQPSLSQPSKFLI